MGLEFSKNNTKKITPTEPPKVDDPRLDDFLIATQQGVELQTGRVKSPNFVKEEQGWELTSEGELNAKGGSFAGAINVPNSTNPTFQVTSDGAMTASSFSLVQEYTAGETITAGRLVCLKHKDPVSWGDDSEADVDTTDILSAFTYTDASNPSTNFGAATLCKLSGDTSQSEIFGKLDIGNFGASPEWNNVEVMKLRLNIVFAGDGNGSNFDVKLHPLTASFDESTITHNTKPARNTNITVSPQTGTAVQSETMAGDASFEDDGYIEFDITQLFKLWQATKITNHGFVITANFPSGSTAPQIGGRTRTGGADYNQAPYLAGRITQDTGVITANDEKIYHADWTEYNTIKTIVGIAKESITSGETGKVYTLADRSVISGSFTTGRIYYLSGTDGQIGTDATDIINTERYQLQVGYGSPNGLVIDFDKNPKFIKSETILSSGILPPPHARLAVIVWTATWTDIVSHQSTGQTTLWKDRINSQTVVDMMNGTDSSRGGHFVKMVFSWATGSSGLLTFTSTNNSSQTVTFGGTVYWYR